MANDIITINESEYNAILRQVVAVIEDSKATIAKNINVSINTTHWKIGMLLHERKLESKHGSGVVQRLSVDLKQIYPEMGVSPRNLWDMKKFYAHRVMSFMVCHVVMTSSFLKCVFFIVFREPL